MVAMQIPKASLVNHVFHRELSLMICFFFSHVNTSPLSLFCFSPPICLSFLSLLFAPPPKKNPLQVYGATYLQKLLEPLLRGVITSPELQMISFEVDPTR